MCSTVKYWNSRPVSVCLKNATLPFTAWHFFHVLHFQIASDVFCLPACLAVCLLDSVYLSSLVLVFFCFRVVVHPFCDFTSSIHNCRPTQPKCTIVPTALHGQICFRYHRTWRSVSKKNCEKSCSS